MNPYYLHRDVLLKTTARSVMELPLLTHAHMHASSKAAVTQKTHILPLVTALTLVSGQRPILTRAKASIASFRLRKHQLLGCKVTLRGHRLGPFVYTFLYAVLPRLRDFTPPRVAATQTVLGMSTFLSFPQLEEQYDIFEHAGGCAITMTTSSHAPLVLSWYGLPTRA